MKHSSKVLCLLSPLKLTQMVRLDAYDTQPINNDQKEN